MDHVEDADDSPPKKVQELLSDAQNVTGAEFAAPFDLDGYLDDPVFRFGFWVGDDEDDAELVTFELNGDQIHGFAEVFQQASDDADALD